MARIDLLTLALVPGFGRLSDLGVLKSIPLPLPPPLSRVLSVLSPSLTLLFFCFEIALLNASVAQLRRTPTLARFPPTFSSSIRDRNHTVVYLCHSTVHIYISSLWPTLYLALPEVCRWKTPTATRCRACRMPASSRTPISSTGMGQRILPTRTTGQAAKGGRISSWLRYLPLLRKHSPSMAS
jgi:hypothetical protein